MVSNIVCFNGLYCLQFLNGDVYNVSGLYDGYDEHLKLSQLEDSDDNYTEYVDQMISYLDDNLTANVSEEDTDDDGNIILTDGDN